MMKTPVISERVWQQQATGLPGDLLKALKSGLDSGALSLTPAHITGLNEYVRYARGLPASPAGMSSWLGSGGGIIGTLLANAVFSANPELNNNAMMAFFRQVKGHASSWEVLFEKNLQLTQVLAVAADNTNRSGSLILDVCDQIKALGGRREAWDTLQDGQWGPLSPAEREVLSSLPSQMNALKEQLNTYSRQVERVRIEGAWFRDETREEVIPVTNRKLQEVEKLIAPVSRDISPKTIAILGLQSRFLDLSKQLQTMEKLLRDVLTGSSHVHSAWQSLTAYIDASAGQLEQITTGQQLARFVIYFGRFLGLWKTIEQSALQMNRTLAQYRP